MLAENLQNTKFTLVDYSKNVIKYAKNNYLFENDDNSNSFTFFTELSQIKKEKYDAIISIEVFEHLKNYMDILNKLWNLLNDKGILIISVPAKGIRDRQRDHINKFTIKSMFLILSEFSDRVNVAPRTYSGKSRILSTAFFYIIKK